MKHVSVAIDGPAAAGKSTHEGTDRDQNYGQEIHDITHFQKPPRLLWPRFVQKLRQLRFRSSP